MIKTMIKKSFYDFKEDEEYELKTKLNLLAAAKNPFWERPNSI